MRQPLTLVIVLTVVVASCSDAAPKVDPENPVVDGQSLTHLEYLSRFCTEKQTDPMCIEVAQAMRRGSTKSEIPTGW